MSSKPPCRGALIIEPRAVGDHRGGVVETFQMDRYREPGTVYDVAVDIDPASTAHGRFVGVELNNENHCQMW